MQQYLDLMRDIRDNGVAKGDRTGTGTRSVFGRQMRFDLSEGFPLVTTKKMFTRGLIVELLWYLSGSTNIAPLVRQKVHIWDEWPFRAYLRATDQVVPPVGSDEWSAALAEFRTRIADDDEFAAKHGELGPVYGSQWRRWRGVDGREVDQIARAVELLRTAPNDRRILVSAWNAAEIEEMDKSGLPPCHTMFQFWVGDGRLSCQLYQRSADYFLGVPFNIASYALLTMMMAQVCDLELGEFVHTFGDAHLYSNHLDQVEEQLSRTPRALPTLLLNSEVREIDDFELGDFTLEGYDPWPSIKAPISV